MAAKKGISIDELVAWLKEGQVQMQENAMEACDIGDFSQTDGGYNDGYDAAFKDVIDYIDFRMRTKL